MYNEELKTKFLDECITVEEIKSDLLSSFAKLEPEEVKKGKDFCTWTRSEIIPVFDKLTSARASGQQTKLFRLSSYTRWCIKNGVKDARKDILDLRTKDLVPTKIRTQMVANPRHLQRYLDCLFDSEDKETTDCTYRCFLWLAYVGIHSDEAAIKVKCDDVDLVKQIVTCEGKEYPIYKEAIPAFTKCKELNRFNQFFPNYKEGNQIVTKPRRPGDVLLRGTKDPANGVTVAKFRIALMRANNIKKKKLDEQYLRENKLDIAISYKRAWLSGVFYRTYEEERAGVSVSFTNIAREILLASGFNSADITFNGQVNRSARFFELDYEHWKEAYAV